MKKPRASLALLFAACGSLGLAGLAAASEPLPAEDLAAVLDAVNEAQVDAAQLAAQRASEASVREFAGRLVDAHSGLNHEVHAQVASRAAHPANVPAARELQRLAQGEERQLLIVREEDFDATFLEGQIEVHQQALHEVESQLGAGQETAEMEELLYKAHRAMQAHLQEAYALRAALD